MCSASQKSGTAFVRVGLVVLAVVTSSVVLASPALGQPARADMSGTVPFQVTADTNRVSIKYGDDMLAQYRYADVTFKPYVETLFTPSGVNVLLDSPPDHVHHHGLMLAVAVDGVNCWEEAPKAGKQQHRRFTDMGGKRRNGIRSAGFEERLEWVDATGGRLLDEQRTVRVRLSANRKAVLLTWRSRLSVPEGKASMTLSGSHYFGLGLRFVRSMDGAGPFHNADGAPGVVFRGSERLVRSNWCAYTAQAEGKDVTVAMFGAPDNPRHPVTWFTMAEPFAYLSATLGLHEEPLKVAADAPLNLCYGVALWDGAIETAAIDQAYQQWLKSVVRPF